MKKLLTAVILSVTMSGMAVAAPDTLTPYQAAWIDYALDQKMDVPNDVIDLLNEFTLDGETAPLIEFIKERARYEDGYNPLKDCRNPLLTKEQFVANCS